MSLFPSPAVSAFADVVIALLEDQPEAWSSDGFCLNHPCGFRIWVCSGFWFAKLYAPEEVKFGWKKILLWRACRGVIKRERHRKSREQAERLLRRLSNLKSNIVDFRRQA